MDDDFSPAAEDPRPFLEHFARRPGMWTATGTYTRVEAFLFGMLMARDEWGDVQEWWERQHGPSPVAWTGRLCEAVTGKSMAADVSESEAPEMIRRLCAELTRFYTERFDRAG